jgi:hypothetical protein
MTCHKESSKYVLNIFSDGNRFLLDPVHRGDARLGLVNGREVSTVLFSFPPPPPCNNLIFQSSGNLVSAHEVKVYGAAQVLLYSFLNSELDRFEWIALRSSRFTPG